MWKRLDLATPCCPILYTLPLPLSGVDWVLLDSCYLHDGDISGWRDFLSDLGVRDLLIFRKEQHNLRATELVRDTYENRETGVIPCVPSLSMLLKVLSQPNDVVQHSIGVAT